MPENDAIRRRALQMEETGKHNILAEQSVITPTSGSVGVPTPALPPSSKEPKMYKCGECLQETFVPAGEKEFTCDVCGKVNVVSS